MRMPHMRSRQKKRYKRRQTSHKRINSRGHGKIAKKYGDSLEINFSIDGASHDVNWKYREGVDWQRAMDNMTSYTKAGGSGSWWFIIFEWNHHQLLEASKMAKNIGIDIVFRYNERLFGLITPESKIKADAIIEKHGLLLL